MIGFNKKKIGFIVDSSSNIKNNDYDDVKVIPLGIIINENGKTTNYLDEPSQITWPTLKEKLMQKKIGIKTSQANMNQMITAAAEMTKKYDQVIVLPIHRGLSGNANSWSIIKDEFNGKLCLNYVDDICFGYVWDIEIIKQELKKKTYNEQQLQEFINKNIIGSRVGYLIVNDLSRLIASGRVKNSTGLLAKLFKIKPIILLDKTGLNFLDKVKTFKNYFEIVKKDLDNRFKGATIKRAIIFTPEDYKQNKYFPEFYDSFKLTFPKLDHVIKSMSNVITCHTGHDFFACYFEVKK